MGGISSQQGLLYLCVNPDDNDTWLNELQLICPILLEVCVCWFLPQQHEVAVHAADLSPTGLGSLLDYSV